MQIDSQGLISLKESINKGDKEKMIDYLLSQEKDLDTETIISIMGPKDISRRGNAYPKKFQDHENEMN